MCAKKTKKGKDRLDKYYHLAKEQGYRSRAAFKLIQLNKKYSFLQNAQVIVDLCAAPGGWLQVARKHMPMTGTLYGVDLASIKKIPNVTTLEADITSRKTLKRIQMDLNQQKADVVLHDGAPNVGSNWLKDAYGQAELVLHSTRMACALLKPNGVFVTKVFRSKDYNSLVWVFNQLFNKVESVKPKASRNASAEIFCVCEGFKAPKEIDKQLFDPAFVFEDASITENKAALKLSHKDLIKQQKKPNREGYEDEAYILYKEYPVSEFIKTEHPINVCVENNTLIWDNDAQLYLNHPATTEDIKIYCKDLKVLGRLDFKDLLKWRSLMAEYREELLQKESDKMADEEGGEEEEEEEVEDEDAPKKPTKLKDLPLPSDEIQAQKELESLRSKVEKMKKNLLKRKKVKESKRMPTPFDLTEDKDDIMDTVDDGHLFSLTHIADRAHLEKLKSASINAAYDDSDSDSEEDITDPDYLDLSKYDLEDEDQLNEILERQLDAMYDIYRAAKSKKAQDMTESRKEQRERERIELAGALAADKGIKSLSSADVKKNSNPLLADFEEDGGPSRKVGQWFNQSIFNVLTEGGDDESDSDQDMPSAKRRKVSFEDKDSDSDSDSESDEDLTAEQKGVKTKGGFETVPQEMMDPEVHATTLATAKKLLRKKARREYVDSSFNRYAFNDREDAPSWFQEDELEHTKQMTPFTKEEMDLERQRFKEINAMPIRAVLETRFRKKRKQMQRMKAAKEKADVIANNSELTPLEKTRELQKLYKVAKGEKAKTITTIARKFKNASNMPKYMGGAKVKVVDRRLKKDMRMENANKKRKRK